MAIGSGVYADEKMTIMPIKPVPPIENPKNRLDVEHNIRQIQTVGLVDRWVDNRTIIVGDVTYVVAPNPRFYSKDQKLLVQGDITQGCTVGLRLNDSGEIYKMWKLAEAQQ